MSFSFLMVLPKEMRSIATPVGLHQLDLAARGGVELRAEPGQARRICAAGLAFTA
jgi:hypothetical protein